MHDAVTQHAVRLGDTMLGMPNSPGIGFFMPTAPSPARILPQMLSSLKVAMSGPEGVGSSSLFQNTKRGALGSPSTSSLSRSASTCRKCGREESEEYAAAPAQH